MWNHWWIRIPVALVFGALSMLAGMWLSVLLPVIWHGGILGFSGGGIVQAGFPGALFVSALTVLIAEVYSSLRKQPLWTISYLIYFTVFTSLMYAGLVIAAEYISRMPVYYYPVAIFAFAVWAGVSAARFHARRRMKRQTSVPVSEVF
ncbi:MAG: hypothetical protein QM667_12345 [Asticcacaulis sp.]